MRFYYNFFFFVETYLLFIPSIQNFIGYDGDFDDVVNSFDVTVNWLSVIVAEIAALDAFGLVAFEHPRDSFEY